MRHVDWSHLLMTKECIIHVGVRIASPMNKKKNLSYVKFPNTYKMPNQHKIAQDDLLVSANSSFKTHFTFVLCKT
jgi:hypothetical protein